MCPPKKCLKRCAVGFRCYAELNHSLNYSLLLAAVCRIQICNTDYSVKLTHENKTALVPSFVAINKSSTSCLNSHETGLIGYFRSDSYLNCNFILKTLENVCKKIKSLIRKQKILFVGFKMN